MDFWLWPLYFLPVSGALRILPEVELDGELGGSVTFQCPLPEMYMRLYLCQEMAKSGICVTVVSSTFVKKEYKNRVTLKLSSDKNLFLVVMKELTESDGGVYACGVGGHTERGKTQKVTLNIHSVEYEPFWEVELISKPPKWFPDFLHPQMSNWFPMVEHATSSESEPKGTTPAQRTEASGYQPSPSTLLTRHPQASSISSLATAKPPIILPPSAASKASAQQGKLEPQGASYNHHTWLHRQRAFDHGSQYEREGQGLHILIPTTLGLCLLVLLGLVIRTAFQRRKAFSRRVHRLAIRMRALEASRRPGAQRPRVSQRPRSQNNVYSACPWRARRPEAAAEQRLMAGQGPTPPADPETTAPPAPTQVPEDPWLHAPPLKTSCEYMSICHQPAAKVENTDSDDYINIPNLTHLPGCPLGPRPGCQ